MRPDPIEATIAHFVLDVVDIRTVPESYSSTVRLLELASGERVVLKIPYVRRKLFREIHAIEGLADLPVPRLIDAWVPDDDSPGALLLSRLPGTVLSGAVTPDVAQQMGELLARLHTHSFPLFGDIGDADSPYAHDWWALTTSRLDLWKPHCARAMPAVLLTDALALFAALASDLPTADGPVWAHHDYRPGNILVQDGRITGLIDFESSRGASADYDFTKVSLGVWGHAPETRAPFLTGYGRVRPVPQIDRTLPLYQLLNALGCIAWCVRRTGTDDPFYRENLSVIEQLVAGA